jgi:hypothetical protein
MFRKTHHDQLYRHQLIDVLDRPEELRDRLDALAGFTAMCEDDINLDMQCRTQSFGTTFCH